MRVERDPGADVLRLEHQGCSPTHCVSLHDGLHPAGEAHVGFGHLFRNQEIVGSIPTTSFYFLQWASGVAARLSPERSGVRIPFGGLGR